MERLRPGRPEVGDRKERGAFFTPPPIARFLADWAVSGKSDARVLDPTCGEAVFLLAAGKRLQELGATADEMPQRLYGVELHRESLLEASSLLAEDGLRATLVEADFFSVASPDQLGCIFPEMDAVIGNPPFVRYQIHRGDTRRDSARAALRQGVRLSGLASSWAPVLVHGSAFLKQDGRLAMVLPTELLTVNYAEPIRRWLRRRFASVHLVFFERLQFGEVLEKVVLVAAHGTGGCDAFCLHYLDDAEDLAKISALDPLGVTPAADGKWTDLLLPIGQRQLFRRVCEEHFGELTDYGSPELGTVTGANNYFALSDATRVAYEITEEQVVAISPPGTRHLRRLSFTKGDWKRLKADGDKVWLLRPDPGDSSPGLRRYVQEGERLGIDQAYKCQIRRPWWRPPVVSPPDLFFTYMSHRFPRLVCNSAGVTFLNSMHGVRLRSGAPKVARSALPLLALNSVTMLGAEVFGRSYGGGVLKMEPREAAKLPVPRFEVLERAWSTLRAERVHLDRQLRDGRWTTVLARVDDVLLRETLGLSGADVAELHKAARSLRERRLGREADDCRTSEELRSG